jgi:hypothetical protein
MYVYIQQQTWRNIAGKLNHHLRCWESLRPQIRYLLSTHTHTHTHTHTATSLNGDCDTFLLSGCFSKKFQFVVCASHEMCHGDIALIYKHCVQNTEQSASCRYRLRFGVCSSLRGLQMQAAQRLERNVRSQTQNYAVPQATAEQLHKCVIRANTLLNK